MFLLFPEGVRKTLAPCLVSYATGTLLSAAFLVMIPAGLEQAHGHIGPLILIGDAIRNFIDGIVIAAAFLTSIPLGIATAPAVIAHEVPRMIGILPYCWTMGMDA